MSPETTLLRPRAGGTILTGLAVGLLAAGCGSSSRSSSSGAATPATTSAGSTAASGGYGGTSSTATPAPGAPATGPAHIAPKRSAKLGTILAGDRALTVYLLTADRGTTSSCTGTCAQIWRPVLTSGAPTAGAGGRSSLVGTTRRPDGTMQVTYHGHPLYYFSKDADGGDAYGQGIKSFGGEWYVLSPAGDKVDKS